MAINACCWHREAVTPALSFAPSGFFALRTPLLPHDDLEAWSEGIEAGGAVGDDASLARALEADRARTRRWLGDVLARPVVREALFLGSPDLEEAIPAWESDPDGKRGRGVERALVRYVARMASRPTPFGLFAGCSVGPIGGHTCLSLPGQDRYVRHSRLDMDVLFAVGEAMARRSDLRPVLAYRPNSSLYRAGGQVRWVASRWDGKARTHHLVAVDESSPLLAVIERAAAGALHEELVAVLVNAGTERHQAEGYVDQLVDSQVLVADLGAAVTGPEPLQPLLDELRSLPGTGEVVAVLDRAASVLDAVDDAGLGTACSRYRQIGRDLKQLPVPIDLARLVQVDLVKPAEVRLGDTVVGEIGRGIEVLHRLARLPENDELARFREEFIARYETREVALVEALDTDVGIGFGPSREPAPPLEGLAFPPPPDTTVAWQGRERHLLALLVRAAAEQAQQVLLTDADVEAMVERDPPPLPDAFAAVATIAASSADAVDRGEFRVVLHAVTGPSGARLLGRFCHADPTLHAHVRTHLRAEESLDPEAVFAEVVHLPEGRIGNILLRPVLRDHEIPHLGRSGAAPDRQILVTDLLVSVRNGRVQLCSARTGQRVVPRLTSAHNVGGLGMGAYRFLFALQGEGTASRLAWSWGPLSAAPFLPRVSWGRIVLSLARWRLAAEDLNRFAGLDGVDLYRAVQRWRAERRLPRRVLLADGDNALPVDFDNVLSVETLAHLLRTRTEAVLEELPADSDELCVTGPEGAFTHEVVVPFVATAIPARPARPTAPAPSATIERSFPPGSEWLYVKLYAGPAFLDRLLREVVRPMTMEAEDSGAARSWFFVRFGDPSWHLRLRLRGDADRLRDEVLPRVSDAVAGGGVWRVELGTYEREVERYGGPAGIELCEGIFRADSEAALRIVLRLSRGDEGLDQRWRLAVRGMDMLLDDLGFDPAERLVVVASARDAFASEHHLDAAGERQLSARFRAERAALAALLDPAHDASSPLEPGFELLRQRSEQIRPLGDELRALEREARLAIPLADVARSLLHMHANRLLRSHHRAQELVIYDVLTRLYRSAVARARGSGLSSS